METLRLFLVIAVIIVWLSALVWMANDVWDTHGEGGCFVVLVLYVFLAPLFPLIVLGYLYMKHRLWYGTPSSRESTERVSQYNWRSTLGEDGAESSSGGPLENVNLSAAESDEELDLLLAEGRTEDAVNLAREKLETAQSFGDMAGMERYRKYAAYIRARGGGRK